MEHAVRTTGHGKEAASWGIAACVVVLIACVAMFAIWGTRRALETLREIDHTRQVRLELERVLISIASVETAMRGYQLSGEGALIENNDAHEEACREAIRNLQELTRDNPVQQERLNRLSPLIEEKIAFTEETFRVRTEKGPEAGVALFRTFKGERLMNEIRNVVRMMEDDEDKVLIVRSQAAEGASRLTFALVTGSSCLAVLLLVVAAWTVQRELASRQRAGRAEAEARSFAESIVDTVQEPLLVLDRAMRIERANQAFHAVFQTRPADVEQHSLQELGGGKWSPPDLSQPFADSVNLGKSFHAVPWEVDLPARGRRSFVISGSRIHRPGNHEESVLLAFEDITARKREEQIHAHFRSLFESLPAPYLVLRPDLSIAAASDAYLKATMTKREDILGKGLFDVFPDNPMDPEVTGVTNLRASLNRVLQNGTSDTMAIQRYDVRGPDGTFEERYWSPVNSPVFSPERQIEYIIHRVEDVTDFVKQRQIADDADGLRERMESEMFRSSQEVQKANQQLRGLNAELEAFSYSVSHDLRAPLRHIDGFADLLTNHAREALDEKGRRYLKTISDSAKRMGTLIDDLLVFSRMGRAEMRRGKVETHALAQAVIKELECETHGRKVVWHCEELPVVEGDEALLRQVFVNLLSNALKYSRPRDPAMIDITSEAGSGERVFSVRDNGVGFDMAYAHKLFGVFQRLHRNDEFEGTGIGLANVQRIINRHGGRVWAESTIGQGATFHFSLPEGMVATPLHPSPTSATP